MIFVSQRPNHDPKPYVKGEFRYTKEQRETFPNVPADFSPRPEFDQTRDPEPWLDRITKGDGPAEVRWAKVDARVNHFYDWAPRHDEFDPPVNRLLNLFRREHRVDSVEVSAVWLSNWNSAIEWLQKQYSEDELRHARAVLARLAAFYKEV